jgi:hypothetical protein
VVRLKNDILNASYWQHRCGGHNLADLAPRDQDGVVFGIRIAKPEEITFMSLLET